MSEELVISKVRVRLKERLLSISTVFIERATSLKRLANWRQKLPKKERFYRIF